MSMMLGLWVILRSHIWQETRCENSIYQHQKWAPGEI